MKIKNNLFLISTVITLIFISINNTFAHPGRTDKYGCHTCRTNCPKWGLRYGEYHCHNKKYRLKNKSLQKNTTNIDANKIYDLMIKFMDLKTKGENLQANLNLINSRLNRIESDFYALKNSYNITLDDEKAFNEALNLVKPYVDEVNKKLPIVIDFIKKSLVSLPEIKTTKEYSEILQGYITAESFIDSTDLALRDLPKLLDRIDEILESLNRLYERKSVYEEFKQKESGFIQKCNKLLSEVNSLYNQLNNIRQEVLDEAARSGGFVTQSQVEEIVYNRARDIYNKIQSKILELKMQGCSSF